MHICRLRVLPLLLLAHDLPIPQRCDWKTPAPAAGGHACRFQYLKGAIGSSMLL